MSSASTLGTFTKDGKVKTETAGDAGNFREFCRVPKIKTQNFSYRRPMTSFKDIVHECILIYPVKVIPL